MSGSKRLLKAVFGGHGNIRHGQGGGKRPSWPPNLPQTIKARWTAGCNESVRHWSWFGFAGAAGAFGYAVYRGHQKMTRLLDMQTLLRNPSQRIFITSTWPPRACCPMFAPFIDPECAANNSSGHRCFLTVHQFLLTHEGQDRQPWTCRKHVRFCVRSFNINP